MDRDLWQTVGLITTWQIAASVCYYAVFAAGPFFRDAFGLSRFEVGLTVTALTLGYAVCLIPVGALTDRYGERVTLTGGLVGLAVGMVLVASASGYASLLVAVVLLGAVYSTAMPGTNKAVYDTIPADRLNTAMGIKQVGITGGSGLSALLVTGLAGYLFWQAGFLVAAVVGAAVAVERGDQEPAQPEESAGGAVYVEAADATAAEEPHPLKPNSCVQKRCRKVLVELCMIQIRDTSKPLKLS